MSTVRVLLADDHAIIRAGIYKTITDIAGLVVLDEVGNGPEVFAALERQSFDLLLIDVTMPEFEPISAIRRIKALYPALKILVVSAYDDEFYVQGLLAAGVDGYHMKDQPLSDMKLAISRVLSGGRWISSSLIDILVAPQHVDHTTLALNSRQRDLLRLLQQGLDNQTIAAETGLSVKTVENNLTQLYRKLNVQSRLEAVNYVMRYPHLLKVSSQEATVIKEPPDAEVLKSIGILVVDDNARYCKQLQRIIGTLYPRATIYEARGIHDALQLVQRVDLHLILIDVVLGEENGITCARRIKALRPQSRIVLISAYPDREFHRQGLQAGAVAFLDKKDLDSATLRQVIDDVRG